MASATEGASCKAVTSALAARPATPESSGPAMNERPAVSAERRSWRNTWVLWTGSISSMRGWLMSKADRVA